MPFEQLLLFLAICVLAGAVAGLFAGLIGIGGGFTTVPILNYLLPLAAVPERHVMHVAVATSLALMIVNTASAAWFRWRSGSLSPPLLASLAAPVALGAVIGVLIADGLADWVLRLGFIGFTAIALYRGLLSLCRPSPKSPSRALGHGTLPSAVIWGPYFLVAGLTGAMAGGGAATFTVPFLMLRHYSMQEAAGQSAALSATIGVVGATSFALLGQGPVAMPPWSLGYLYLPALAGLLVGGQLAVRQGLRLAGRLSEQRLRQIFLSVLAFVLLAMLGKQAGL